MDPKNPLVNLILTVEEVNQVLAALQVKPYNEVSGVINNIMTQGQAALAPKVPSVEPPEFEDAEAE